MKHFRHLGALGLCCALAAPASVLADEFFDTGVTGGGQPHTNMQPSLAMNYLVRTAGPADRLGEITLFAGSFEPQGWRFAHGQAMSAADHPGLFNALGHGYGGSGDTFRLPDLRGRTAIGTGQGPGLSSYTRGDAVGSSTTTLTIDNLPAHTHGLPYPNHAATEPVGQGLPWDNRQPSLAVQYGITTVGVYPSRADGTPADQPFIGQVVMTAASTALPNTTAADGRVLGVPQNSALFSVVGDYGDGSDPLEFALPDTRGRAALGAGQGPSLTDRPLGQQSGSETASLSIEQMPAHDHSLPDDEHTAITGGTAPLNNTQPGLALNYIINAAGAYPPHGEGESTIEPFIGQVALFAGNFAPAGWLFAHGQELGVPQNQALFSVIGQIYGGDEPLVFNLPDLRGRVPVGADSAASLGQVQGLESIVLTQSHLPPHSHQAIPEPATASILALLTLTALGRRRR